MSDESPGYQVKEQPATSRYNLVCSDCGSDNIEFSYWCYWNKTDQELVIEEPTEDDAFCSNCGERVDYEKILIAGEGT